MHTKTHYDTLHIDRSAKPETVAAAYHSLVQKCRDELRPNADASKYLKAIGDAYAVLYDPSQRAAYDAVLDGRDPANHSGMQAAVVESTASPADPEAASGTQLRRKGLVIVALAVAALAWGGWFVLSGDDADQSTAQETLQPATPIHPSIPLGQSTQAPVAASDTTEQLQLPTIQVPQHDQVPIEKLVGAWRGSDDAGDRIKNLDMQIKSPGRLVFQLDTKVGQNIGEIFGVATFENGYAHFHNTEYGCSIVFTMKAQTVLLTSSGCQAYRGQGADFDGQYVRPQTLNSRANTIAVATRAPEKPVAVQPALPASQPAVAPVANTEKLYRFIATVKDGSGKTQRIELVAANEAAARAILRDFRGNPTVVRIRKAWF